jgi:hypothetical protein
LVNGVRGTLALGLFYHGKAQFGDGASANTIATLDTGFGRSAQTLEQLMGVRVAKKEEIKDWTSASTATKPTRTSRRSVENSPIGSEQHHVAVRVIGPPFSFAEGRMREGRRKVDVGVPPTSKWGSPELPKLRPRII